MKAEGVKGVQLQGRLAKCLCFADIMPMFLSSQKCRNMANSHVYKIFKNVYNENMRRKNFLKAPSIDHHVCKSVGVHVCMYVCIYLFIYVSVYVCIYVSIYLFKYVCMYLFM